MNNPKFPVTISYVRQYVSGQQSINLAGVTSSVPTYAGGYFIANMYIANLSATGSTYETSLSNLLAIATASTFNTTSEYYFE